MLDAKLFRYIFVAALFLQSWSVARAEERLILIGGGERPVAAMKQFAEYASSTGGRVLIITWATSRPSDAFESLKAELRPYLAGRFDVSFEPPQTDEQKQKFFRQLQRATGVFFSGGSQARILDVFNASGDAQIKSALKAAYSNGAIFGGTSAGTAVMSQMAILGYPNEAGEVPVAEGLGLLPAEIIVDQHFSQRDGRRQRLLKAQAELGLPLAVGVDEDTAVFFVNGKIDSVMGRNTVRVFNRNLVSGKVSETILTQHN